MSKTSLLFVIGFMGSGKTAVSAKLGKFWGREWIDLDAEIAKCEGKSIPAIFEQLGENGFRDIESRQLNTFSHSSSKIISCGGGIVLRDENIRVMRESGTVVLLKANPQTIFDRVRRSAGRPLLNDQMNVAHIAQMMERRRAQYEKAADIVIETDGKSVEEVAGEAASAFLCIAGEENG